MLLHSSVTARRTLALCLGAAALIATASTRAQPACLAATPDVAVQLDLPSPTIDNSLPQPALQVLAGKRYHGGRTLGLYQVQLEASFNIQLAQHDAEAESCIAVDRVRLRIEMPRRTIYVVRARQPGTCAYDSVLAHERKHEATDNAVLRSEIPSLKRDIGAALRALPSARRVPLGDAASARESLMRAARAAIEREAKHLFDLRAARQAAIDTPQEYRRVRAACG